MGWPKNPRALAGRLRGAQTFLRALGIEITYFQSRRPSWNHSSGCVLLPKIPSARRIVLRPNAYSRARSSALHLRRRWNDAAPPA